MHRSGLACLGVALLLATAALSGAHGDFETRLERATQEIALMPDRAGPLLGRAELYRRHGSLGAARADLDRATELEPALPAIVYQRVLLLIEEKRPGQALATVDGLLAAEPGHVPAHIARAQSLRSLGRNAEAAKAYSSAIARASVPSPDAYLARARALAASGPSQLAEAIAGLDEGMEALGPLPILTHTAVDLEVRAQRYDAALARLEAEISTSKQPAWALTWKGEILDAAGRRREARAAYAEAAQRLFAQPAHRRGSSAWRELEKRIARGLGGPLASRRAEDPKIRGALRAKRGGENGGG